MSVYEDVVKRYNKPVIISEFGSAERGGNKAQWIIQAMKDIKKMPHIQGFVLFNVDKEAKWRFTPTDSSGKALKAQLQDKYFIEQ